jgi:hypothetical protein
MGVFQGVDWGLVHAVRLIILTLCLVVSIGCSVVATSALRANLRKNPWPWSRSLTIFEKVVRCQWAGTICATCSVFSSFVAELPNVAAGCAYFSKFACFFYAEGIREIMGRDFVGIS